MTISGGAGARVSRTLACGAAAALSIGGLTACGAADTLDAAPARAPEMERVEGDRFTVSMPGTPERSEHKTGNANTVVHMAGVGADAFAVSYTDHPKGSRFDLDQAVEGAARSMLGDVASTEPRTVAGKKGLDARVTRVNQAGKAGEGTAFLTTFASGTRVYTIMSVVQGGDETEPAMHDRIVDSLTLR